MNTNIKLLKDESRQCIFNIDDYSLFDINEFSYNVMSTVLETGDITTTSRKFNLDEKDLSSMLKKIGYREIQNGKEIKDRQQSKRNIQRITLHVSNDCNLRCKYCYASGGGYGKNRGLMTLETARRFVNYCCANFDRVENIVFFGGEPFLNIQIIEFICNYFHEKFKNGEIPYIPKFGAITNGTLNSDKILNVIREYFSFLTVSIDGPKEINDLNRVTKDGSGSFDRIAFFLKNVSIIPKLKINIEATYTSQHIEKGFSREMIKNYFRTSFNLNADIVDEMSLDKSSVAIENLDSPLNSPWFESVLKTIVRKRYETKCQILRNIFAVSIEGDIYPCHMNVGDGMLPVSSIWDSGQELQDAIRHNIAYRLKDNNTCNQCWARNICGGCSRLSFYDPDKKTYRNTPLENHCDDFKKIISKTLLKICEVRKDTSLWSDLLNQVNRNTK